MAKTWVASDRSGPLWCPGIRLCSVAIGPRVRVCRGDPLVVQSHWARDRCLLRGLSVGAGLGLGLAYKWHHAVSMFQLRAGILLGPSLLLKTGHPLFTFLG